MILTIEQMRQLGVCESSLSAIEAVIGPEAEVTRELCLRLAGVADFDWAAGYMLSAEPRAAYRKATAEAGAAYRLAMAEAFWQSWSAQHAGA